MRGVEVPTDRQPSQPIRAALLLSGDVLDRFGRVLRHLIVGLVDQAVSVQLVSSDPRIESLTLGPVQTVVHEPIAWPFRQQKLTRLGEALAPRPLTIVHAFSGEAATYGSFLSNSFDAELFVHISSMRDVEAIGRMDSVGVVKFLAVSEPLAGALENDLNIAGDRIELVRPGVQASEDVSCFGDPHRAPTLLCISNLTQGCGVDRLIDAMHLLDRRKLHPMLFILGDGPCESNLRALARKRKLESRIAFANPLGDTLSMMRSADIFVHPRLDTEFTADPLTAIGTGILVVACPGVADYLRHEQTAVLCEDGSVETLAHQLAFALDDRERARRIARGGLEYVREHHGVSVMAERVAQSYRAAMLARATFRIGQ